MSNKNFLEKFCIKYTTTELSAGITDLHTYLQWICEELNSFYSLISARQLLSKWIRMEFLLFLSVPLPLVLFFTRRKSNLDHFTFSTLICISFVSLVALLNFTYLLKYYFIITNSTNQPEVNTSSVAFPFKNIAMYSYIAFELPDNLSRPIKQKLFALSSEATYGRAFTWEDPLFQNFVISSQVVKGKWMDVPNEYSVHFRKVFNCFRS